MKVKTLAKIALGLTFPLAGMAFLTQNKISNNFSQQTYFLEAVELIKGYKPALERLGEPVYMKKVDISDAFNYQDEKIGRVKITVVGQNKTADIMVHATKVDNKWNLDYMEIKYPNTVKYKFYDSSLVTKKSDDK